MWGLQDITLPLHATPPHSLHAAQALDGTALGYPNPFGHLPSVPTIPHSVPAGSQSQAFCIASSSLPPTCNLDDYCETCGHSATMRTKLEALGFEPGNTLDKIPSVEYEKVGFKYLECSRVVKADKAHHLLAKAWQSWWHAISHCLHVLGFIWQMLFVSRHRLLALFHILYPPYN